MVGSVVAKWVDGCNTPSFIVNSPKGFGHPRFGSLDLLAGGLGFFCLAVSPRAASFEPKRVFYAAHGSGLY